MCYVYKPHIENIKTSILIWFVLGMWSVLFFGAVNPGVLFCAGVRLVLSWQVRITFILCCIWSGETPCSC